MAAACFAQEPSAKSAPGSGTAERRSDPGKPGPEHEKLAAWAGTWAMTISMGTGQRALVYEGAATNRMTVGGRFLQVEYAAKGAPGALEGIFVLGFDPRHQNHTLIAMDSFGPYFVTSKGKRDEQSGKIKMFGTDDDPQMKAMGLTKEFVHLVEFPTADEFSIEVWFIDTRTPERKEMKFMTYRFTDSRGGSEPL